MSCDLAEATSDVVGADPGAPAHLGQGGGVDVDGDDQAGPTGEVVTAAVLESDIGSPGRAAGRSLGALDVIVLPAQVLEGIGGIIKAPEPEQFQGKKVGVERNIDAGGIGIVARDLQGSLELTVPTGGTEGDFELALFARRDDEVAGDGIVAGIGAGDDGFAEGERVNDAGVPDGDGADQGGRELLERDWPEEGIREHSLNVRVAGHGGVEGDLELRPVRVVVADQQGCLEDSAFGGRSESDFQFSGSLGSDRGAAGLPGRVKTFVGTIDRDVAESEVLSGSPIDDGEGSGNRAGAGPEGGLVAEKNKGGGVDGRITLGNAEEGRDSAAPNVAQSFFVEELHRRRRPDRCRRPSLRHCCRGEDYRSKKSGSRD